jgi:hypothetical protein
MSTAARTRSLESSVKRATGYTAQDSDTESASKARMR